MFLADDSLFVREGVRALLAAQPDLEVVGVAEDFDGLVDGATESCPQVVVTDIRMPPSFQDEGIEAAKLVRKRNPGTGVVVLSQYDEPEYAISLLSEGAAGYAYLLKDRVGDGDQLVRAVREVATGGSMLDPAIVNAIVAPARADDELDEREDQLLPVDRRGPAGEGDRGGVEHHARSRERCDRRLVPEAREGSERGCRRRAAPAPSAAEGDRRSRRAGRDAEPAAPGRPRGEDAP